MCHAIILTALMLGVTEDAVSAEVPPPAAIIPAMEALDEVGEKDNHVRIRVGLTTLTASSLNFSEPKLIEKKTKDSTTSAGILVLEGDACCSIQGGDVVIAADRLEIEMHDSDIVSIAGLGNCKCVDEGGDGLSSASDRVVLSRNGYLFQGEVKLVWPNGMCATADQIRTSTDGSGKIQILSEGRATLILDD